jgi:hypothetical protein
VTAAAARSAAVLCALRRAAAERRSLRVALVLGGLLALGFFLGGQAHAAESPASASPVSVDADADVNADISPSRDSGAEADIEVSVTPSQEIRRVATESVASAREVTQPVKDTARHLTRPLTQGPVPVPAPVPPVQLTPPGVDADQSRTPQLTVARFADESVDWATAQRPVERADRAGGGHPLSTVMPVGGYISAHDRQWVDARHEAPAPAPTKPCNSSQGALPQSGETHTPRAGDQPAATSAYGMPYALAPGAVGAAAEPPTRERPRDILEFPG